MLVNFRCEPTTLSRILPKPFRPKLVKGWGMAGICLIRLGNVKPAFFPGDLGFNSENALASYVKVHDDPKAQAQAVEQKGDVKAAFASAAKTYKAEFHSDYGYHAQMEPMNAVVRINEAGDKVEVWEGSQSPDTIRNDVASALGLKPEQVTVNDLEGFWRGHWLIENRVHSVRDVTMGEDLPVANTVNSLLMHARAIDENP